MNSPLFHIVLFVAGALITWWGSSLLEKAAEQLSGHYRLPPIVQGSMVLAVGSSFPELSTAVLSPLLHGEFDLGVAAVTGSAIFNILVIPSLSALLTGRINVDRELIFKDGQFYILSLAVLLLTFSLAVIYYPVKSADTLGQVTRPLALIPLALYGLYIFLQQQDTVEHKAEAKEKAEDVENIGRVWLRLGAGLLLILAGVEGLIRSVLFWGDQLDTPSFFWGATVLAAVTSAPDLLVSLRSARRGKGDTSLGNVLGSNTFDLLVAIPAGVLIAGSSVVNFSQAVPMMFFLILATILILAFLRHSLDLSRKEAWVLLLLYLLFILYLAGEVFFIKNGLI